MAKLTLTTVRTALKLALGNSLSFFNVSETVAGSEADAITQTNAKLTAIIYDGLRILDRLKPLRAEMNINLIAGQNRYDLPATTLDIIKHRWGEAQLSAYKPWNPLYPKKLPSARVSESTTATQCVLSPCPSAAQLNALGNFMPLVISTQWHITETDTGTVSDKFLQWVVLACQCAAMQRVLVSRAGDPLKQQQSKNLNPAAVKESLMAELNEWAQGRGV